MNPIVQHISKWNDPRNTFRATTIDQVFDLHHTGRSLNITYDIGKPLSYSFDLYIRNKSLNTDLEIELLLPFYFEIEGQNKFTVGKNSIKKLVISFNEQSVKTYSSKTNAMVNVDIDVKVKLINVSGPVYIRTDLNSLAESIVNG